MVTFIIVWALPIQASELSEAKSKKSAINDKLSSISKSKTAVKQELGREKAKKDALAAEKETRQKQLANINSDLYAVEKEREKAEHALKKAEKRYNDQKELVKTRLRALYENSDITYLQIILEAKSLTDLYDRAGLISIIAKSDREMLDTLEATKKDLEYKRKKKQEEERRKALEARSTRDAINSLSNSADKSTQQIEELNQRLKELERQEDAALQESYALSQIIRNLQSSGGSYNGGKMLWPAPSCKTITSPYGMRFHPVLHVYKMHTGIDIGARYGASIVAAKKGTVIQAGWNGAYGYSVIIDHGGQVSTLYGHCSQLLVHKGQNVSTGQTIAKVGSTGYSTGAHLHFEVRKNGNVTNPLDWVSR
jgi:murein DD-endopeptidase MepM/ murein hydrolase activator NlpD